LHTVTCLLDFLSSNHDKVSATKLGPTVNTLTIHWHSVSHSFFQKWIIFIYTVSAEHRS